MLGMIHHQLARVGEDRGFNFEKSFVALVRFYRWLMYENINSSLMLEVVVWC